MKKLLKTLSLSLFSLAPLLASFPLSADLPNATLTWDFAAGYRQDDLKWSIAAPFNQPNILSELEWTNLQIPEVSALFKTSFCNYLYFRAYADYGWIVNGKNRDSDYHGCNRTIEWSRSINKADKGHVWDASIAAGWTFPFWCEQVWFNPIIGYSLHHQDLHMLKGNQVIWTEDPSFIGPFSGLNSTYNAHWKGFWAGFDMDYYLDCPYDIALRGTFEYHWNTQYHADGHWNLRREFCNDFHHQAKGYGVIAGLGVEYDFLCGCLIGLSGNYQNFWTNCGWDKGDILVDRFDSEGFIVGRKRTKSATRLNKVEWHSWNILGHINYQF